MRKIYLDYNASTPMTPQVVEAMWPFLRDHYGNPSSAHWAGRPARDAIEAARGEVAALIGASPEEIVFTSGGSEANNHAIKGTFFRSRTGNPHIVTTSIEHPAVHGPCKFLEMLGARVTVVHVDSTGMIDPDDVRRAVTAETILISAMHANNEVGTIEPIREIGLIARERRIPFHTDAAQSVGKITADVRELCVDMMSIAGHKLYAPKGVGALYIRAGSALEPLIHGASHEGGRRAGTENLLLAVGLGAACRLARLDPCEELLRGLRDLFWNLLRKTLGERVVLNGHPEHRLPNTLNVSFPGHTGPEILDRLEGIAASTGAACHSGSTRMSPVLAAMGVAPDTGLGAIRFSVGRMTIPEEIDETVRALEQVLS